MGLPMEADLLLQNMVLESRCINVTLTAESSKRTGGERPVMRAEVVGWTWNKQVVPGVYLHMVCGLGG